MKEQIYTIPLNETLDRVLNEKLCTCPMCLLEEKFEQNELDLIMGASMMEPDIRIKTNEQGFCTKHFEKMLVMKNKLGLALMLESHLEELKKELFPKMPPITAMKAKAAQKRLDELEKSCYVCSKVEFHMTKATECAVYLCESEPEFFKKMASQPYFCIHHYNMLLSIGRDRIDKKKFGDFYDMLSDVERKYFDTISEDVSWFCKKFDYRYADEPWKNSKDACERTVKLLK